MGPAALAMQVVGGVMGGLEQNRAARASARVDEENARRALLEGEQQGMQTRRDERLQAGAMLAAMGGSGIELGSGSAADVLAESAYQRELEVLNIRTRAGTQAANLRQAAADKRKAGRAAILQGVFGAAATALEGASAMRDRRAVQQQRGWERDTRTGGQPVPKVSVAGVGR